MSLPQYAKLPQHDDEEPHNAISIDEDEEDIEEHKDSAHISLIDTGHINRELMGIHDLDKFFKQVYSYFVHKGFWCLFVQRFLKLFTVLFVVAFTFVLFVLIDWNRLWTCHDQESCNAATANIIRTNALRQLSLFQIMVIIFELGVFCYWIFLMLQYVYELYNMWSIKSFYNNDLKITEADIQTIEWEEVVNKIVIDLQKTHRISTIGQLTAHDIMNRIMRRENYLIALINKGLLNLSPPLIHTHPIMTESLLWNLRYMVDQMFNHDFKIRDSILDQNTGPKELSSTFKWLGIMNLIASPFIFFFIVIYSVFKYSVEIRKSPLFVIERRWSTLARWKFREFNELPHLFEKRLRAAYKPAAEYCDQFPMYLLSIIGKSIMFLTSSFAAVIIVLSTLRNPILLYFSLLNQNMLWWLTALIVVWGFAKSLVIDEHIVYDPNAKLEETCQHIHYYPDHWHNKGHHLQVKNEFFALFPYSIQTLILELASIFITPMILLFSLPSSCVEIVKFLEQVTTSDDHEGHICGYASFDFTQYGDESADLKISHDSKMERSFINFRANYVNWVPPQQKNGDKVISKWTQSMMLEHEKNNTSQNNKSLSLPVVSVTNQNGEKQTGDVSSSASSTPLTTPGTAISSSVFDNTSAPPAVLLSSHAVTDNSVQAKQENMLESRNLFHMLGSSIYPSKRKM